MLYIEYIVRLFINNIKLRLISAKESEKVYVNILVSAYNILGIIRKEDIVFYYANSRQSQIIK